MADLAEPQSSQAGMTDLINATKGQALNTGALVQSSQNQVTQATNQVTQTTNLVTATNNLVTQTTNLVTQTTNLVTAFNSLSTSINNALSMGPWSTWSPTVTSNTGTITTLGAIVARYTTAGKTVYFTLSVTITTNGTAGGFLKSTLPLTAKATTAFAGENTVNGKGLSSNVSAASNIAGFANYDASYPGADGAVLVLSGVYEAQ